MTPTQLRYFLAVAEELHFGRAAQRVHIEQSPLSRQIKQLEEQLGVTLFLRASHRVELTDAGRALVPEAQAILEANERAKQAVRKAQEGVVGLLSVCHTHLAIYTALPKVIAEYRRRYPQVAVTLRDNLLTPYQINLLQERRIDIGVVRPPVRQHGIAMLTLSQDELVVVLPQDHPLASARAVRMQDLREEPFVCFERTLDSALQTLILRAAQDSGYQPRIAQEVSDIPTMLSLVAAGIGVALAPASARNVRYRGIAFRQIHGGGPPLEMSLAWNTEVSSRPRDAFIELAKDFLAESSVT